ncbi:MAG: hypothetical protein RIF36_26135 [Imperialibacter sp.]|uniref:hypothetical protein n=1 Tax=Imperialibacter sp. TaxID=2038411 RepID=UPI0032EDC5A6
MFQRKATGHCFGVFYLAKSISLYLIFCDIQASVNRITGLKSFDQLSLNQKINKLYVEGEFLFAIRYYGHKVNLYQLGSQLFEVFYNHKYDRIDKIEPFDDKSTRIKFYADQIKLPLQLF